MTDVELAPRTRQAHPDAIFVQLTTGCNATCVSCPHPFTYGASGPLPKGNMSNAVWNELVHQIRSANYQGQVGLYLHHEPLLVKSLFDKIKDVNRTDAFVVLSTNGALLNEEAQEKMLEALPRQIHINISSADKLQYEQIMGLEYEATFANARRFIERAKDRIAIEINCPVLPGVDAQKLVDSFPGVRVNIEYWANSRGGLLENVSAAAQHAFPSRRLLSPADTEFQRAVGRKRDRVLHGLGPRDEEGLSKYTRDQPFRDLCWGRHALAPRRVSAGKL